ncbi:MULTISPECIES: VOC family protein [unclassified Nocardioides]|uniref:VOC family protein n=1 Tax=unclassified Nocardioides TaxID=2615069 RepID=UPI001172ABEF|nr:MULTISPECIES: VOC family protein [unclassified Nocardioides]TQK71696.1 putative 3-demethylubiquinone-9 3-methyltransferase (glyoxalase superfamily) [Nocardioides sp. SLBN-35]WGY04127.1 VOC family protein [Nocardioides sp. QY071]
MDPVCPGMSLASSHIQPCLWFDDRLEEAARFYTAIFPNSSISHLGPVAGEFTLDGLTFRGVNGGPEIAFSEAVSFSIVCRDQSEVDYYWDSLADGGQESVCGWLKDRFGLSWQVVPARLHDLLSDPDPRRAEAASRALLGMRRIVVAQLEAAADAARAG